MTPGFGGRHPHAPDEAVLVRLSNSHLCGVIEAKDAAAVEKHRWRLNDNGYIVTSLPRVSGKNRNLYLHRMLMGLEHGDRRQVDHINRDKLDNRRCNLRLATVQLNSRNLGLHAQNSSGFRGVSFDKRAGKWHAYINVDNRREFLGYFNSAEEAARVRDEAAIQLHGEFAALNDTSGLPSFGGKHPHRAVEGNTCEWWTPPKVFEALGLRFDLDPCAPPAPDAPWLPVDRRFTVEDDGLSRSWNGRVWLNSPYGRETAKWLRRFVEHGNGIALVFARTETRWWHDTVPRASAVCFIKGRLTFIPGEGQSAPGNSGGPSALIAFGERCAEAVENCGLGIVYGMSEKREGSLSV